MAVLSDYTDGTITVTNGSVDFTGTNTLWRSAAFREGDTVLLQGFTGVIAGTSDDDPLILSNTAGQFTEPWPGASGTFAYRMRYQPDNARFSAKSTMLINLLANGILRGIADVGVEDGKLLIGNVAGLYDLIDKSELGIQDPNGSLGKLASSTAVANRSLQTDNSNNIVFAPLGLELIASDTNNSEVAAWVKTGLGTTYREIFMFVDAAPVNSGGALNIQLSSDNGATWLTATSEYSEQALVASGTTVTAVAPSSPGIGSGATAASVGGGGAIMDIKLGEFNQFRRTMYSAFVSRRASSGAMELVTRNGIVTPWAPFNAMRLVCSNGNLARFRVVLMGVRG